MFAIPNVNAACAPISFNTSVVDLLSKPLAVNLANSSSATLALSIFTALVFALTAAILAIGLGRQLYV